MRTTPTNANCFVAAVRPRPDWRDLAAPSWVADLLRRSISRSIDHARFAIEVAGSTEFCHVTVRLSDAASLAPATFEQRTGEAYNAIADQLRTIPATFPIRFWNFIPAIHAPMDARRDRYMVFNAGRFEAFASWYGGPQAFETQIATASGVGHDGDDLVIHCLASSVPGRAVENPRQVPPYHYSARFGPRPPCFSRATVVNMPMPTVLVGGTASIRGEDSVYVNSLHEQTEETLDNLASLLHAAEGQTSGDIDRGILKGFRDIRVYHPNPQHAGELRKMLSAAFPSLKNFELIQADLCRPELLVEIEGVADLPAI